MWPVERPPRPLKPPPLPVLFPFPLCLFSVGAVSGRWTSARRARIVAGEPKARSCHPPPPRSRNYTELLHPSHADSTSPSNAASELKLASCGGFRDPFSCQSPSHEFNLAFRSVSMPTVAAAAMACRWRGWTALLVLLGVLSSAVLGDTGTNDGKLSCFLLDTVIRVSVPIFLF